MRGIGMDDGPRKQERTRLYYEEHAEEFVESTRDADMSSLYAPFEECLPAGARILDLGFGSGRDTLHFLSQGYEVVSVDNSARLVEMAKAFLPNDVRQLDFMEMEFDQEFDGIWACAALVHCTEEGVKEALLRCGRALKPGGILYVSFKFGRGEVFRNGRWFLDMDESALQRTVACMKGFEIGKTWESADVRDQKSGRWTNALIKKSNSTDNSGARP